MAFFFAAEDHIPLNKAKKVEELIIYHKKADRQVALHMNHANDKISLH